MSIIINYLDKHLMIHSSEVIRRANISISNEENTIIKEHFIEDIDFVNLDIVLKPGNYHIKISSKEKEILKSIIVN